MRRFAALVLAVAAVFAFSGATLATGPSATTYHGTWDEISAPCAGIQTTDVSGQWTVVVREDHSAIVTISILIGTMHDASWGGNYYKSPFTADAAPPAGATFAVVNAPWGYDYPWLSFALVGQQLTFTLHDFCMPGDAVIYGTLTH
jgi:hypothetical protein